MAAKLGISGACSFKSIADLSEQCIAFGLLLLSILEAVLTVSPNRQYLGLLEPTTFATQGPC